MQNFIINQAKKRIWFYIAMDMVLVLSIFLFSYVLRMAFFDSRILDMPLSERVSWIIFPGVIIHIICFYMFGLYDMGKKMRKDMIFIIVVISVLTASLGVSLVSYAFPGQKIGRILNFIHIFFMCGGVYFSRVFLYRKIDFSAKKGLLFLGWDPLMKILCRRIQNPNSGYEIKGIVAPPEMQGEIPEEVSKSYRIIPSASEGLQIDDVQVIVISKKYSGQGLSKQALIDLKFQGMEIFDGHHFYEQLLGRVPVIESSIDWLLYKSQTSPFQPDIYMKVKRVLDILISLTALILTASALALVAVMIKLDSKGPIFFRQQRLGQYESEFDLLKFRTMVDDAEKLTGPKWADENDTRFTRMGKFLRKTRLDEFPQFINVLKGEMSVIGPRPIRKHFADLFAEKFPFYRLRFKMKPGITGWAQSKMDYVNTVDDQYEKLEYEFYYLYHHSIFMDMFIILKTIQSVFKMRGG